MSTFEINPKNGGAIRIWRTMKYTPTAVGLTIVWDNLQGSTVRLTPAECEALLLALASKAGMKYMDRADSRLAIKLLIEHGEIKEVQNGR